MRTKADLIEELNYQDITELIEHHRGHQVNRYHTLYELYKGHHHSIKNRVVGENKPNNKLMADFYGKLVDTEIGYFLGQPIVFNCNEVTALDEVGTILVENEFDELIMEVGKEASIKGLSYMLIYQDEDSETKLCRISPENMITLDSKRGNGVVGVAIRFYEEILEDNTTITYIEMYDRDKIVFLKSKDGVLSYDERFEVNPLGHIYGQVPVFPFKNNEEGIGSFEKCISLVEAYDQLLSDTSNEHEAYRNAYLVFKNISANSEIVDKLKQNGIIEVFDDGDVKFVTKDIQDSAISAHLDRLANDIHKFSDIPDLTDEKFAGNLSGVAIRFKLLGLENKCIIKERKMVKSIRKMFKALNNVIDVKCGEVIDTTRLQIIFTRNIPNNLTEIVDSVVKLNGIVDKETLLSLLPFVDSPIEILEKLEAENDEYANDVMKYEDKVFTNTMMSMEGNELDE